MSPRPRREERHPDLQTAIKETAWKQIAEAGASALGLRAIARELKITAPSIYNYFPRRDDLVTALIVDAYNSLADVQENALAGLHLNNHAECISALGLAYRQWAVTYPQRYQLIFGTPIPAYHAPDDVTLPAATRALVPLISVLQAAREADCLRVERFAALTPPLQAMLSAWQTVEGRSDVEALYLALVIWSRVHGLVMLEIGNHIPPFIQDPAEVFQREIKNIIIQYL
jgi:AcrR family transcriptional regulator